MKQPLIYSALFSLLSTALFAIDPTAPSPEKTPPPPNKLAKAEYEKEARIRISNFKMPDDITASLYVDSGQTQNPSAICFDEKGRLYIAEIHRWRDGVQDIRDEQRLLFDDIAIQTTADRLAMYEKDQLARPLSFYTAKSDRIKVVEDTNGDGRADKAWVWADGFNDTLDGPGIGLLSGGDGVIYYADIPNLWRLEDSNGDGKADKRESLQSGFGVRMSLSGHDMHGLVWGPDGKIYWSIGDRGYSFTTKEGRYYHRPMQGAVFRCDPDGSNLEEYYHGLRNPQELAFDQYGNLFTCDNDADSWDTGRLVYILEGGDSGWTHGHQAILNFHTQLGLRTPSYQHPGHSSVPMNPWITEALWSTDVPGRPAFALPPVANVSWGPSGLVYNYGAVAMPGRYANHFWVCNFGGARGNIETFSVKPRGAGFQLDQHEVFVESLGNTDVEFGPDGRMYLSCFNNNGWYKQDIGNVYALSNPQAAASKLVIRTKEILLSDFKAMTNGELDQLLSYPDMRVRQRAQFALAKRKDAATLLKAARQTGNRLKRLHGIWGLGQLFPNDETLLDPLIHFLSDQDPEIRAQTARVLSDSRKKKAGEALVAALDDPSARVKAFAAIGVGKCRNVQALPRLVEILAENNNQDVYLRHACVQGLWSLNFIEKILNEMKNESAAVRLGIALTLRKLRDPRISYLLRDPDPSVRNEAIRAINDLNLVSALPALAALIVPFSAADGKVSMPKDHWDLIIQTRLINANFRVGKPENAERLLAYAAQSKLPDLLREQALKAIAEWPHPTVVDPTVGIYRPIDPATRPDISKVVQEHLPPVFHTASGALLALAIDVALQYNAAVPVDLLTSQIRNKKAPLDARVGAIYGLTRQQPEALRTLWDFLLTSKKAEIRAAATRSLLKVNPDRGLKQALALADSSNYRDRQNAYRILAAVKSPKVTRLFADRLGEFRKENPGSLLDLLESAARRDEKEVQDALAAYRKSLDPKDLLSSFLPCLEGGDPAVGKTIFATHAAGQCAKCHKIKGDGGVAGPDLTEVASRTKPRYRLESLIEPSAVVVPGYGLTMLTLKNGESVGGTLLKEDKDSILLRLPDPEHPGQNLERRIALHDIATRLPPVSAMPPMMAALTKAEIRDLLAYLSTLKGKKRK